MLLNSDDLHRKHFIILLKKKKNQTLAHTHKINMYKCSISSCREFSNERILLQTTCIAHNTWANKQTRDRKICQSVFLFCLFSAPTKINDRRLVRICLLYLLLLFACENMYIDLMWFFVFADTPPTYYAFKSMISYFFSVQLRLFLNNIWWFYYAASWTSNVVNNSSSGEGRSSNVKSTMRKNQHRLTKSIIKGNELASSFFFVIGLLAVVVAIGPRPEMLAKKKISGLWFWKLPFAICSSFPAILFRVSGAFPWYFIKCCSRFFATWTFHGSIPIRMTDGIFRYSSSWTGFASPNYSIFYSQRRNEKLLVMLHQSFILFGLENSVHFDENAQINFVANIYLYKIRLLFQVYRERIERWQNWLWE